MLIFSYYNFSSKIAVKTSILLWICGRKCLISERKRPHLHRKSPSVVNKRACKIHPVGRSDRGGLPKVAELALFWLPRIRKTWNRKTRCCLNSTKWIAALRCDTSAVGGMNRKVIGECSCETVCTGSAPPGSAGPFGELVGDAPWRCATVAQGPTGDPFRGQPQIVHFLWITDAEQGRAVDLQETFSSCWTRCDLDFFSRDIGPLRDAGKT